MKKHRVETECAEFAVSSHGVIGNPQRFHSVNNTTPPLRHWIPTSLQSLHDGL